MFTSVIPATTTATATVLPQGVTSNNMIGYKGYWKGHFHRIALQVGTTPCFIRVIHFLWKQSEVSPSGVADYPTLNSILQNSVGYGTAVNPFSNNQYTYLSPQNLQWAKQFKLLQDDTYKLTTVGNSQLEQHKKKLALNSSFRMDYIADEQDEGGSNMTGYIPYVMFISSVNTVAAQPSITYYSRLSYVNY